MLTYGIPSYKLEKDVVEAEIDVHPRDGRGHPLRRGGRQGRDAGRSCAQQGYKAFYVAIGCQGGRKAGVPGEDARRRGHRGGLPAQRAAEEEKTPSSGKAVVIGGGNVAIDVARSSVCAAARTAVAMYCLEARERDARHPPRSRRGRGRAAPRVHCGWGPKEILTEDGKADRRWCLKRCVSVFDAEGRFCSHLRRSRHHHRGL